MSVHVSWLYIHMPIHVYMYTHSYTYILRFASAHQKRRDGQDWRGVLDLYIYNIFIVLWILRTLGQGFCCEVVHWSQRVGAWENGFVVLILDTVLNNVRRGRCKNLVPGQQIMYQNAQRGSVSIQLSTLACLRAAARYLGLGTLATSNPGIHWQLG